MQQNLGCKTAEIIKLEKRMYTASGKTQSKSMVLTSNKEPVRPHFFAVSEVVQFISFIVREHCSHVLTFNQL